MFMLMSHYRSPLNYSGDILLQAKGALERLTTFRDNIRFLSENGSGGGLKEDEKEFAAALPAYRDRFVEALDDDFNTADAVAVIFELVRDANAAALSGAEASKELADGIFKMFGELTGVLGIFYGGADENESLADEWRRLSRRARPPARRKTGLRPTASATESRRWASYWKTPPKGLNGRRRDSLGYRSETVRINGPAIIGRDCEI
jgi:cysteinyl-tRNA synthetase